jgi:RHS repeat-associated protein
LQGSIAKIYTDLGIETDKVTGTAGNSGNTPPGQSNTHPDNGNNGGGNDTGGNGTGGTGTGGNGTNNEKFIFYYHPDHLGSSSYISDANGEVTQHLEYFAFGETFLEEHSNTDSTPYLFNGKELDEETGLYYFSARYYQPREQVWASVDEMAEKYPNYSPYAYCANNPIRLVDPDGKEPTPYEAALMAAHAYGGGNVKLSGGWKVSNAGKGIGYINADTGFKSALYERTVSGKTEYTYATGGTDLTSVKDWKNNATQEFGLSEQYDQSVKNAGDLKNVLPKGAELTFTGHSLGGGLAEANAIITGDKAITFNAAGVSIFTSGVSQKSNTLAFIMTTDPLNALQQSSILPTAGGRKQLVAPRSTRGWYNGHSIFSMLDSLKAINDGGGYKMIEVLSKKWSDLFIKH